MFQTEIQFFWPLTEQTELDLDFSGCEKPKLYTFNNTSISPHGGYLISNGGTISPSWVTVQGNLKIDSDTTVFSSKEEPPFYRRWLFKLLGIKWQKKD